MEAAPFPHLNVSSIAVSQEKIFQSLPSMAQEILRADPKSQLGFPSPQPLSYHSSTIAAATTFLSAAAAAVAAKAMPNDHVRNPLSSTILDRFRDMINDREDDLRRISHARGVVPPPSTEEIVGIYELLLSELTVNSKPVITDLTIVAKDQREHARGIADAVCARIMEVPADQKLPALYLLDSIVKNIGREYVRYFSTNLPRVFCEAYNQVQSKMHPAMRHLFRTWSSVFPSPILQKIEAELHWSLSVNHQSAGLANGSASEFPRPSSNGLHVNPNINIQRGKGTSTSKSYGQRSAQGAGFDVFDFNQGDGPVPLVRAESLTGYSRGKSAAVGADQSLTSVSGPTRSLSPSIDRPRALINAYGQDDGKRTPNSTPLMVDPLTPSGMNRMAASPWQNSEEEEFDWGEVNPDLRDPGNRDPMTSSATFVSKSNLDIHGSTPMDTSFRMSDWHTQVPKSKLNNSTEIARDTITVADHGSVLLGVRNQVPQFADSCHPQETWKLKRNFADLYPSVLPHGSRIMNQAQQVSSGDEVKNAVSVKHQALNPHGGLLLPHQPTQPYAPFQQHLSALEAQQTSFPSSLAPTKMLPSSHGYPTVSHPPASTNTTTNQVRGRRAPMPPQSIFSSTLQTHGAVPSAFLPWGLPAFSQSLPFALGSGPVAQQTPGNALSGLINSLVAQGVISLPEQDTLGVDFDQELLKVRHESVVCALHSDLPRQCRTCGLRLKSQEEHSKHMDWHVIKNRSSRNRKQNPSRKWFVSASMWLTGAEASGTDAAPRFFPTETTVEKRDDDEVAVPADEDQPTCALCGERFEEFFSHGMDEWMYKGAVYLNAPDGSAEGLDKSDIGPIVHAKCRPDSGAVPPKDLRVEEGGTLDEENQRKRRRT